MFCAINPLLGVLALLGFLARAGRIRASAIHSSNFWKSNGKWHVEKIIFFFTKQHLEHIPLHSNTKPSFHYQLQLQYSSNKHTKQSKMNRNQQQIALTSIPEMGTIILQKGTQFAKNHKVISSSYILGILFILLVGSGTQQNNSRWTESGGEGGTLSKWNNK